MPFTERGLKIFTGKSNPSLVSDIVGHLHESLDVSLGDMMVKTFSDGEVMVPVTLTWLPPAYELPMEPMDATTGFILLRRFISW